MTSSHATLIPLDRRRRAPIFRQIYEGMRTRILNGDLAGGQPVPSTRELAMQLRVSRFPVLNAYAQLLSEGYLESRAGAGTFVSHTLRKGAVDSRVNAMARALVGERRVAARVASLPPYERPTWQRLGAFQVGQPDVASFPLDVWTRIAARHARTLKPAALAYGDIMGHAQPRECIAAYVRTSRGVQCDAEQVMIVSGSQQALDLIARALLDPEAHVWVEDPGYWLVQHLLKPAQCRMVAVPVDDEGLDVAAGIRARRDARAAFVAPSHQYPLGVTMSATRRLQLLDWAQRANAWIVEDDYDSEYRYDGPPISSLQGLDTNGRVIYVGTFSKVVFPSLRIGYLVLPRDLVQPFCTMRQCMDISPSTMNQQILATFMREGHFARHVRRMRRVYAERRAVLVDEITRQLPGAVEVVGAGAGMHVTVLLDPMISDVEVAEEAGKRGVIVSPLSASCIEAAQSGLVLGFGNTPVGEIASAVTAIRRAILHATSKS